MVLAESHFSESGFILWSNSLKDEFTKPNLCHLCYLVLVFILIS